MNHMTCDHIDFVPAKCVRNWHGDMKSIMVFSRKRGNKVYKKKDWPIGIIYRDGDWQFEAYRVASLSLRTMMIVTAFMCHLNDGKVKFDTEKGELTNE